MPGILPVGGFHVEEPGGVRGMRQKTRKFSCKSQRTGSWTACSGQIPTRSATEAWVWELLHVPCHTAFPNLGSQSSFWDAKCLVLGWVRFETDPPCKLGVMGDGCSLPAWPLVSKVREFKPPTVGGPAVAPQPQPGGNLFVLRHEFETLRN